MTDEQPRYQDRDWLWEQYWQRFRSTPEIAERCSGTQSTIVRWLDEHDIPTDEHAFERHARRDRLPPPVVVERLHWEDGLDIAEIADAAGVNPASVSGLMDRHGIETRGRPSGERHVNYVADAALLDDLIAGRLYLGEWPSKNQHQQCGEHSPSAVINHFGSWEAAIAQASERYAETKEQWPDPEAV